MICPNCNHQNPEGANQCEACFTPLPTMTTCPQCGAPVLSDATFCGQCGFTLQSASAIEEMSGTPTSPGLPEQPELVVAPVAPPPDVSSTSEKVFTQLQQQRRSLLHVQTQTQIELPQGLAVIHLGKPNEKIPPDIDVSGFPNADIVSRIHADIRVEGDIYYIEDRGSSNGTYINHTPLVPGNRHRLRSGDRLALGKGDLMTFVFQLI